MHVVIVYTGCIRLDLTLVPRLRVDVDVERTMTRFLFFGYTLAYSSTPAHQLVLRYYSILTLCVCIQPGGRLEDSNLLLPMQFCCVVI
jgi:hypothetical protein